MPPDHTGRPGGSPQQPSPLGVVGVAVAMVACCAGLPLLAGAGIAIGAAGLVAGSAALVAAALVLGVLAWRRRAAARCARAGEPATEPRDGDRT